MVEQSVLAILLTLLMLLGGIGARGVWRGDAIPNMERALGGGRGWSQPAVHAFIRANPSGLAAAFGVWVGYIAVILLPGANGVIARGALTCLAGAGIGIFVVSSVLMATAVLFNAPKRVVPPMLRDEPGLVATRGETSRGDVGSNRTPRR